MDSASLPDLDSLDRQALMALLIAHRAEFESQQSELASRAAELASRNAKLAALTSELESKKRELVDQGRKLLSRTEYIEHLKLQLEKLRRMLFGTKSEKIIIKLDQLELHMEEMESARAELETAIEAASPEPEVQKPARKPLPGHLPREIVRHLPHGECCTECGGQLRQFGEDVSEQLEYIPENFKAIRHVRPKFACSACDRVVEAPAPSRPVERGIAGPALLAHVLISKYADYVGIPVMLCEAGSGAWMLGSVNFNVT